MKHTRLIIAVFLILIVAANANAFDGQRKGFIVGLGVGYTPVMKISGGDQSLDKDGIAQDLLVGYAWNNQNAVFLLSSGGQYEDDFEIFRDGDVVYRDHIDVLLSFSGPCFRHYFSAEPQSFFVQGALGSMGWMPDEPFETISGPGFLVGAGYEFIKHYNVTANLAWGKSDERYFDNDYLLFSLIACGMWY